MTPTDRPTTGAPDRWSLISVGLGALLSVVLAHDFRRHAALEPSGSGQGFPLDDAWIHAQFALNTSRGAPVPVRGRRALLSGSTAPLWSLLEGALLLWRWSTIRWSSGHLLGVICSIAILTVMAVVGRSPRLGLARPHRWQ